MVQQQNNLFTEHDGDTTGLHCPTCDYELTGLKQNCCPECGETFDVDALRESQRKRLIRLGRVTRVARVFLAITVANLLFQIVVSILVANDPHALGQPRNFFSNELFPIRHLGLTLGLFGFPFCNLISIAILIRREVKYYQKASLIGLVTFLLSVLSAFVSAYNYGCFL